MKESFQREYVKCGKGCKGCPHGPYWYAYWWEGGKTRKRYVGKDRPGGTGDAGADGAASAPPKDWRDAIYDRSTATLDVACRILGVTGSPTRDATFRAYRQRMATAHPDRGGTEQEASWVNAAFTWLKVRMGW